MKFYSQSSGKLFYKIFVLLYNTYRGLQLTLGRAPSILPQGMVEFIPVTCKCALYIPPLLPAAPSIGRFTFTGTSCC